jgi:hypothetical protein
MTSEAANLIWVIRCECMIQEKNHIPHEIRDRQISAVNCRLTKDKIKATKISWDKRATQRAINTWEQLLKKEGELLNNWINISEVLVGRRPPQTA